MTEAQLALLAFDLRRQFPAQVSRDNIAIVLTPQEDENLVAQMRDRVIGHPLTTLHGCIYHHVKILVRPAKEQASQEAAVLRAARVLDDHYERRVCYHDNTHRGGTIWTICDDCGAQWADDRGGFKAFEHPAEVLEARRVLGALRTSAPAVEIDRCKVPLAKERRYFDTAVEVCAICDIAGCHHIRERNAKPAAPAAKVKPLAWEQVSRRCWDADGMGKLYRIIVEGDGAFLRTNQYEIGAKHPTLEAAKHAAQEDFDARIRAQLVEP